MTDTLVIAPIPRPLTPLIGRDRELAMLLDLIRGSDRLITLTGIGGIGKTRLAHQTALEIEPEFTGGAVVVPLADIRDASLIPTEIARRFGRTNTDFDAASLPEVLGNAPLLLILDNLEQIPDVGEMIADVLEQCASLTILATSQIPLDVPGEQLFPVEPMDMGKAEAGSLRESPAIQLFLHRAKQVDPSMEIHDDQLPLVAEICHVLDGIPLAIELAAARMSIFSLQELRERLTNTLPVLSRGRHPSNERHRTMRNAIAWSYDLLDPSQQRLFRYLGVYAGGLSLDALQHTLRTLEITGEPLDTVSIFTGRGLLRRYLGNTDQPRYQMLQTLREFAWEQLKHEGDEFNACLAHASFVCSLAEDADPHLHGPDQAAWVARLSPELNNIQTACEWAVDHRPATALRIISALWRFFQFQSVAPRFIEQGRQALQHDLPDEILAKGWAAVGLLENWLRTDPVGAAESFRKAITYADAVGDTTAKMRSLTGLGVAALHQNDLNSAYEIFSESHRLNKAAGNFQGVQAALSNMAIIHSYRDENDDALDLFLQALDSARESGDQAIITRIYANLSSLHIRLGNLATSADYAQQSLALARDLGNEADEFNALYVLSIAAMDLGDLDAAEDHIRTAITIARKAGRQSDEADLRTTYIRLHLAREDVTKALQEVITVLDLVPHGSSAAAIGSACASLAQIGWQHPDRQQVASLLGAVDAWRERDQRITAPEAGDEIEEAFRLLREDPETRSAYHTAEEWDERRVQEFALQFARTLLHALPDPVPAEAFSPQTTQDFNLTPREQEVLGMMATGLANAEIAGEMFVSTRTVTTHITNIFNKMDVKNRSAAVALAHKQGLLKAS